MTRANWAAVVKYQVYYVSELRLAMHIRANKFPKPGDTIRFLANVTVGRAKVKEFHHNLFAGHIVLEEIENLSTGDAFEESTTQVLAATVDIADALFLERKITALEQELKSVTAEFKTTVPDGKLQSLVTKHANLTSLIHSSHEILRGYSPTLDLRKARKLKPPNKHAKKKQKVAQVEHVKCTTPCDHYWCRK